LAQKSDDLKAKIEKLNEAYIKATIAGDIEATLSFYTEDIIYMPNYSKMTKGIEAMRMDEEASAEAGFKVTAMTLETLDVMDCGDLVYEIGLYEISMSMPQMPEPIKDKGKYVTIWEKKKKDLKMKLEIWNTDNNPWEDMMGKPEKD
jgi:ketosteroid isomerase-like protein